MRFRTALGTATLAAAMVGAVAAGMHERSRPQPLHQELDRIRIASAATAPVALPKYRKCLPELPIPDASAEEPVDSVARQRADAYLESRHPERYHQLRAWVGIESSWRHDAVSELGAVGFGQLMPLTAEDYGLRSASADELRCLISAYAPDVVLPQAPHPESSSWRERQQHYGDLMLLFRDHVPYGVRKTAHAAFDPKRNIRAGVAYLEDLGLGERDDWFVFTSYHSGMQNVKDGKLGTYGKAYFPSIQRRERVYAVEE